MVGFKHFDDNAWGGSGSGALQDHTIYWGVTTASTQIIAPTEEGGALTATGLRWRAEDNGATVTGDIEGESVFCTDQIRLDPAGIGNDTLTSMRSDEALATDYDGRTRTSPFDMGANERGTCPYP